MKFLDMQCNKEFIWHEYYYKKADLYRRLNLPDSALITTNLCIAIRKKQKTPLRQIHAYNAHGLIALSLNKLDTAIASFQKAVHSNIYSVRAARLYPVINGNIGQCYYLKKDYEKAYVYLLLDVTQSLENNVIHSFISASFMLAKIEIISENYTEGISRAEDLLRNYNHELSISQQMEISELLMQTYQSINNTSKRNFYREKWTKLTKLNLENEINTHQGLADEIHANSLRNVMTSIENEKKIMNQEILILEKDKEKNRLENGLLISGLALVTIVILFFL